MLKPTVKIRTNLSVIKGRPDLTPLVDVLFLLLIFFILSSSFVEISGVEVKLPETESLKTKSITKVIISINEKGNYYYHDEPANWDRLQQILLDLSSRKEFMKYTCTIVVRADRNTPFGNVARLLALAEKLKINTVIATVSPDHEHVFDE